MTNWTGRPADLPRRVVVAGAVMAAASPSVAYAGPHLDLPEAGGRLGWTVAQDGVRLRYAVYGRGMPGFVLVHGWCCDRSYWNAQVRELSRDATVVTLDLPGCGDSPVHRTVWSMEGLGDDVARVVRASGVGRAVLVGHSMGGSVVLEAARRLPGAVEGLVTVDTLFSLTPQASGAPPPSPAEFRSVTAELVRKGMFTAASDPVLARRVSAAMAAAEPGTALALVDALARYDVRAGLAAVAGTPLTMIDAAGRPVDASALRSAHPGLRILTVAGVGHFVMLDAPVSFNALLRGEADRMTGMVTAL